MEIDSTVSHSNFGLSYVVSSEVLSNLELSALADFSSLFCLPFAFEQSVDEFNYKADALKWLVIASGMRSTSFALLIMSHYAQFEGKSVESIISVNGRRFGPVAEASEARVRGPGLPAAVALVVQR